MEHIHFKIEFRQNGDIVEEIFNLVKVNKLPFIKPQRVVITKSEYSMWYSVYENELTMTIKNGISAAVIYKIASFNNYESRTSAINKMITILKEFGNVIIEPVLLRVNDLRANIIRAGEFLLDINWADIAGRAKFINANLKPDLEIDVEYDLNSNKKSEIIFDGGKPKLVFRTKQDFTVIDMRRAFSVAKEVEFKNIEVII